MTANRLGKVQQVSLSHCMDDAASSTAASAFGPEMSDFAPGGGSGEQHPGMPDGPHDLLHLCLAVLYAAGLLLPALVACLGISWLHTAFPRSFGLRGSPRRGRPPDRGGRGILTPLCVLRT